MEEFYTYKCPKDIVQYGEIMDKIQVTELQTSDYLSVKVAEIYDPSKFWIIINNEDCSVQLDKLMDEMQIFYNQNSNYYIPEFMIRKGTYCAAIIYGEYHRAVIVGLVHNDRERVKVFFVDYGTVSTMPSKGICYLHKKFFSLPQQGVRARLAGIYPINSDTQWSRTCCARFFSLARNKDLFGQIHRIDEKVFKDSIKLSEQFSCFIF